VIHKLGRGGFSTVWFCRDILNSKYVAVKVMTADVSTDSLLDLRLINLDRSAPKVEYLDIPEDHFSLEGPTPMPCAQASWAMYFAQDVDKSGKSRPHSQESLSADCASFEISALE
jgi:serine/threonine protein kinase